MGYSVSATTRAPRRDERDGVAYHFLSRSEFLRRVEAGEFLEWAEYAGELYGTPRASVDRELAAGRHVVLAIEVEGARQVRRAYPAPRSVTIFLLPPDLDTLLERLRRRKTEDGHAMARRLERAVEELREAPRYDHVVENDELTSAVDAIERIIDGAASPVDEAAPELAQKLRALGEGLAHEAGRLKQNS
jgi:guanylate kinase